MPDPTPLIIGHRGAAAFAPENTLASFRLAFETYGVDMIEFDVRLSRDGIPVIIHDAQLERTTNGKGYAAHYSAKQLKAFDAGQGEQIPTLEEVFETFAVPQLNPGGSSATSGVGVGRSFAVELKEKSPALVRTVMDLVKKFRLEERVVVGSKHHPVSQTMKKNFPAVKRFLSQQEILGLLADYKRGAKQCPPDPGAVASVPPSKFGFRIDAKAVIDFFHSRQIQAFFWTINDAEAMKELAIRGVEGIITDNPGTANQAFNRPAQGGTAPKGG